MTTLANMTPQERAQCVGMWAETSNGLAIIIEPFYTDGALDTTVVFSLKPEVKIEQRIAAYTTPRFDLPRAWGSDGKPPAGEWEHISEPRFQNYKRRWLGDWEDA